MLVSLLHSPVDLTLGVTLGRSLSFVVELLALAEADLHLHPAAFQVDAQGDQGKAVLLDLAEQPHNLPAVHQQTAGAAGVRVEAVSVVIGGPSAMKRIRIPEFPLLNNRYTAELNHSQEDSVLRKLEWSASKEICRAPQQKEAETE